MKPYIIFCGTNGRAVVFGYSDSEPVCGEPITLANARMVLYWPKECNGVFGLAANGPKSGLRLSPRVDMTATEVVRQFVTVTQSAAKELDAWT